MTYHKWLKETLHDVDASIQQQGVIVGKHAALLAIEAEPSEWFSPIEIVVNASALRYLTPPEWYRVDSVFIHVSGKVRAMTRYGSANYEAIVSRGWIYPTGMRVAGLPDIYGVEQMQGDTPLTKHIRKRLQDPYRPPLPLAMMPRELRLVTPILTAIPRHDSDQNMYAALRLSVNALYTLFTLYGDPAASKVNQIVGAFEQPQQNTMAYYHNAFDIVDDMRDLQRHLATINASVADRLDGLVADLYTDIIYGFGRSNDAPLAYDERLSANLLYAHAVQLGYSPERAERLRAIVLDTSFDEQTKWQKGRRSQDPVSRAVTSVDLQTLSRPGIEASIEIALENMTSRRQPRTRLILSKLLQEDGLRLSTLEEAVEYIRKHRDRSPKDDQDSPKLLDVFLDQLEDSAAFHESYEPAHDWTLDDPEIRRKNAQAIRRFIAELQKNPRPQINILSMAS